MGEYIVIKDYGKYYGKAHISTPKKKLAYSIKRISRGRWIIYRIAPYAIIGVVSSKLQAYYVATVLSGVDITKVFHFGDAV
jgi:hypothetical protein